MDQEIRHIDACSPAVCVSGEGGVERGGCRGFGGGGGVIRGVWVQEWFLSQIFSTLLSGIFFASSLSYRRKVR